MQKISWNFIMKIFLNLFRYYPLKYISVLMCVLCYNYCCLSWVGLNTGFLPVDYTYTPYSFPSYKHVCLFLNLISSICSCIKGCEVNK